MNKNEIKKFLKNKEIQMLKSSRIAEREATIEYINKEIDNCGIDSDLEKIISMVDEFLPVIYRVENKLSGMKQLKTQDNITALKWYFKRIYNESNDIKGHIAKNTYTKYNEILPTEKKYSKEREELSREFNKIRGNISAMNGKQATEYLQGLGFELEKEEKEKNEILSPVNMNVIKKLM